MRDAGVEVVRHRHAPHAPHMRDVLEPSAEDGAGEARRHPGARCCWERRHGRGPGQRAAYDEYPSGRCGRAWWGGRRPQRSASAGRGCWRPARERARTRGAGVSTHASPPLLPSAPDAPCVRLGRLVSGWRPGWRWARPRRDAFLGKFQGARILRTLSLNPKT